MSKNRRGSRRFAPVFAVVPFALSLAIGSVLAVPENRPRDDPQSGKSTSTEKKEAKPLKAPSKRERSLTRKLLELHNKERAKEGLAPLELDDKLTEAARRHALDMAERGEMSHQGSDGSNPEERIERAGFRGKGTAENVARWYPSPKAVMKGWMESPGHKKNILGDYRLMGAGFAVSEIDDHPYWCVDFGLPWPKIEATEASETLVRELNDRRAQAKKPKLVFNSALARIAEDSARAAADSKGGVVPNEGSKIEAALKKAGYSFLRLGIAGAGGQTKPSEVVDAWMRDPSSARQILGEFREIGVGVAADRQGAPVWRILLASPQK